MKELKIHQCDENLLENENLYFILGVLFRECIVAIFDDHIEFSVNDNDLPFLNDLTKTLNIPSNYYKNVSYNKGFFSSNVYLININLPKIKQLYNKILTDGIDIIPSEYLMYFIKGCCIFDHFKCHKGIQLQLKAKCSDFGLSLFERDNCVIFKQDEKFFKFMARMYATLTLYIPSSYSKFLKSVRFTKDELMMEAAHLFSNRSTCVRRKVGCVITNKDKMNIISIGYNGGIRNGPNYCDSIFPSQCGCIHAEINALLKGNGEVLYCTTMPCKNCAKAIINAGVKEVFFDSNYRDIQSLELFKKSSVRCSQLIRKDFIWKYQIAEILRSQE